MKKPIYILFLLALFSCSLFCGARVEVFSASAQAVSVQESVASEDILQSYEANLTSTKVLGEEEAGGLDGEISSTALEFTAQEAQSEANAFRVIRQAAEKISLSYIFPVNSAILEQLGFSADEINTYRFYLTIYVAALASQNRDRATSGVEVTGPTYYTDVDGIGFSIIFDDLAAQKEFFGVSEDEEGTADTKTSGLFVRKTTMTTSFPVSETSADNMKSLCAYAIASFCSDKSIADETKSQMLASLEESVFIYDFASAQTALKSDLMADDEVFHHNLFVRTYSTLSEEISFYYTSPNVPLFYLSAILFTLLVMAISYFFLKHRAAN